MLTVSAVIYLFFAAVFFYTGANYLINLRSFRKEYQFTLYSLLCFFGTGYALSTLFKYHALDVHSCLTAVKFQHVFARMIMVILPWFVGFYADYLPKRFLTAFSLSAFLVGAAKVILPNAWAYPHLGGLRYVIAPWGEPLADITCDTGVLTYLLYALYLALIVYCVEAARRLIQRGQKNKAWPLILSLGFGLFAFANDVLVDLGVIRNMYLEEYAIFLFILIVGAWLSAKRMHAEGNYRTLFHSVGDAIFVHDARTGKVLDVNETAARMFGATRQELITMDFRRMTVEKIDDSSEEALGRLRQAAVEGPQVFEWQSRRVDDGRVFSTEVSLRLEKMNNQEVVLASVRDISLRKKVQQDKEALENQMRQAQKLESLGLMAGGVAHDFNNLLTVILGNASLAKRDLAPNSASVSALDKIATAVQRAAALCQQLLAYSGKSVFLIEHYDLNDIVKDLTGMMEVSIPKKVRLNLQLETTLPPILGDATQIRQVVMNLITNAAEAIGEEKGSITVTTSSQIMNRENLQGFQADSEPAEGPYVALEVVDTGSGMDGPTIARIFEPFFTTKFTGRGLGMAAVMGIIRGHRGGIQITSELKKGTRVTVLFPAADKAPVIPAIPESLPAQPASKGRVLLVDDDGALLKTVEILVKDMGFQALTAENGKKALEIFEREHQELSCVLMDLTMPDMDGGEALLEMKRVNPRVRVILASGYSEQVVKDRIRSQDIFAFLQKPYSLEALEGVLQSASRASA